MDQRWLVDSVPPPKAWTSQRSDPFNGNSITEQVEGATSHGLLNSTITLRLTQPMLMYMQAGYGSGTRKDQMCHCWI